MLTLRLSLLQDQSDHFLEIPLELVEGVPLAMSARKSRHGSDVKLRLGIIFDIGSKRATHNPSSFVPFVVFFISLALLIYPFQLLLLIQGLPTDRGFRLAR